MGFTYAPAPFDDPLADIIIRSANGVDFKVLKVDLIRSLPVFKGMLSLPQSAHSKAQDEYRDEMPVVPVSESTKTLTLFLRFCVFGADPVLESFEDIVAVMAPARKYQHLIVEKHVAAALLLLAKTEPVGAYALGCVYGMEAVAREAALLCLRHSPITLVEKAVPELDLASGQDLRRLLDYRNKCAKAVSDYMSSWTNPGCGGNLHWADCETLEACRDSDGTWFDFSPWWSEFLTQLVATLQGCTWEGAILDGDFANCALVLKPCGTECSHPSFYTTAFASLATLRTNIAQVIDQVKLEFPHSLA